MQSGGMFNSYKVKYSPETHNLLKVLMDEVKLTTAQRSQMREYMKRGQPLPVVPRRRAKPSYVDENLFGLKKNYYFSRRSRDQIILSGAYEKERYRFLDRTIDLEKEKERLQNVMERAKNGTKEKAKISAKQEESKREKSEPTPEDRVEELIFEIEDRMEFLKEMESLGKAKEYEAIIKQEIAAKLRELKKLDKSAAEKHLKYFETEKN